MIASVPTTSLPTPVKGKSDWREYRSVQLPNGVTLVAVQDKESKTTAVAASVNVGASSDPRDYPGLAHFLEHMCFLGSEKYPGENDYKSFLSLHGGQSNASTSLFLTTYKFEVLAAFAEPAIDIFAQFFVSPLLTASGTEREIHAVDSENSKNLTSDLRRRLQILKDVCLPDHYFTKFTTGNVATLLKTQESVSENVSKEHQVEQLRQALLCFHANHYRSDNLTVVAVGPQPIEQLLEWMVPRFALMTNRSLPPSTDPTIQQLIESAAHDSPPHGYPHDKLPFCDPLASTPALITTKPVKSQRRLVLMFPLPPTIDSDRCPMSVLSHLLGHEGPHSSFAVLQDRQWITALSAGARMTAPDFNLFQIDLQLTPLGEDHWKDVVAVLLQHAQLIHQQAQRAQADPTQRQLHDIWGESVALSQLFFHQTSPSSAYDFAPALCRQVVQEGPERCLSAGSLLKESADTCPVDEVADAASRLTIDRCLIERCSTQAWEAMEALEAQKASGVERRKEPWYGIDYFRAELDDDNLRGWKEPGHKFLNYHQLLDLPRPNRYIPTELKLCPDLCAEARQGPRIDKDIDPPKLLVTNHVGRMWHRLDDRYALPKSVVSLLLRNAAVENVPTGRDAKSGAIEWQHDDRAVVLSSLLSSMYAQAQAQETYDAALAGLHWSLSLNSAGVLISCSGFSDRLPDLALKILEDFITGDFLQENHFVSCRDRVVRNLKTFLESRRADSDAMYYRDLLLTSNSLGVDSSLEAAEAATLEAVKAHHVALMQNEETVSECLFTGNVSSSEATRFFNSVSEMLVKAIPKLQRAGSQSWIPGDVERRLPPGGDVELHFASKNPQEENGAVLVTYQSPIPGYKGEGLSTPESLRSTAAMRLLSHMLREPMFDELRTKQTLGYVVSSYYDWFVASRPSRDASLGPSRTPVDSLVINVLSRKLPPPEVRCRIDDFLEQFRETLLRVPDSQIQHHASALSTKLLKPIHKLGIEANMHFSKISRYAPEVLDYHGKSERELPWKSVESLARAIGDLKRADLIQTWDRLILPKNRARIVSCVYGSTFPLTTDQALTFAARAKLVVVNDATQLVTSRRLFPPYDKSHSVRVSNWSRLLQPLLSHQKPASALTLTAAAVIGTGIAAAGWTLLQHWRKPPK